MAVHDFHFTHLADDHLVEAVERIGTIIAKAMEIPIPGTGDDSSAKLASRLRYAPPTD